MSDLKREDVEALLATLEQTHKPNNGTLAELCRIGLAWLDAETFTAIESDHITGCEARIPLPLGQRVRVIVDDEPRYTITPAGREHLDGKA